MHRPDIDSLVRYLYQPGELEKDTRGWATDPIWNVNMYETDKMIETDILYYLKMIQKDRLLCKHCH